MEGNKFHTQFLSVGERHICRKRWNPERAVNIPRNYLLVEGLGIELRRGYLVFSAPTEWLSRAKTDGPSLMVETIFLGTEHANESHLEDSICMASEFLRPPRRCTTRFHRRCHGDAPPSFLFPCFFPTERSSAGHLISMFFLSTSTKRSGKLGKTR